MGCLVWVVCYVECVKSSSLLSVWCTSCGLCVRWSVLIVFSCLYVVRALYACCVCCMFVVCVFLPPLGWGWLRTRRCRLGRAGRPRPTYCRRRAGARPDFSAWLHPGPDTGRTWSRLEFWWLSVSSWPLDVSPQRRKLLINPSLCWNPTTNHLWFSPFLSWKDQIM